MVFSVIKIFFRVFPLPADKKSLKIKLTPQKDIKKQGRNTYPVTCLFKQHY